MKEGLAISEIKERLRIPEAWRLLNLAGEPSKCCKSPFREDTRPSFSVYAEGRRFKDFADATCKGDVLDFIALALACGAGEAIQWARGRVGGGAAQPTPSEAQGVPTRTKSAARWPALRTGTESDLMALHDSRRIGLGALRLATKCGFLHFGSWYGGAFWALTDKRRQLVELRRIDGHPWAAYKHLVERKSHCIGSGKAWPLGIEEAEPFQKIALMEGAPDFLACFEYLLVEDKQDTVAPLAMLGGANHIAPEAAAVLRGKEVWLYPHADEAGQAAALVWARTLLDAGATVRAFDLSGIVKHDGTAGKDLCDSISMRAAVRQRDAKWQEVMP